MLTRVEQSFNSLLSCKVKMGEGLELTSVPVFDFWDCDGPTGRAQLLIVTQGMCPVSCFSFSTSNAYHPPLFSFYWVREWKSPGGTAKPNPWPPVPSVQAEQYCSLLQCAWGVSLPPCCCKGLQQGWDVLSRPCSISLSCTMLVLAEDVALGFDSSCWLSQEA